MKISRNWLQEYIVDTLPSNEQLDEVITNHIWEVEEIDPVGDDFCIDIKVLPDRAHDALSHYGIAREVAGLLKSNVKPLLSETTAPTSDESVTVTNNHPACIRYASRVISGVTVGESPAWLRNKLEVIGQRSINNVVDATNYVLFATGQPTHAFDADKVSDGIVIRSGNGDTLTTLDNRECVLDESVMVIADIAGHALAIAGIKGGTHAQVDTATKNIILEVANFDATMIRATAKKLGIATDASKRFENEISPVLINDAMELLTQTIIAVASGNAGPVAVAGAELSTAQRTISVTTDFISARLGKTISPAEISNVLQQFKYEYLEENGVFTITIPAYRLDLNFGYDMVDEIGRVLGYDTVAPVALDIQNTTADTDDYVKMNQIRNYLLSIGYNETITYSFTKKGDVEMYGGIKGKSCLRTNIIDGLRDSYEMNKTNAALLDDPEIRMFEIGSVFPGGNEVFHIAMISKTGGTEYTFDEFFAAFPDANNAAMIDPATSAAKFKPWSLYPYITRDIAVWVPESTDPQTLVDLYTQLGTELLVRAPRLVDQFSKEGRTSYAYRLVFQSFDRTLTDDDIKPITDAIYGALDKMGYQVR